jgi:protein O-mannosyl-transferase
MKANGRAASAPARVIRKARSEDLETTGRLWRKEVWAALALCAIALLVYANSFETGFVLDNAVLLKEGQIHEATRQNIGLILQHTYWWPTGESGLYRPLTILSFLFNYAVLGNGEHPAGYHWINFILHAVNVVLAFAVALRIIRKFWLAVFIAGLWAVHPLLTESVTNIVGRADLLAGMSVLGGFLIYLKATESTGWRRLAWLGGLLATTTVGVFSKESAVTVIGVIALYELTWWRERGKIRDLIDGTIAILPPLAVFLYQRSLVLAASPPAVFPFVDNPVVGAGFWVGRLTALKVMARYLMLVVWPARLSSDYSYPQVPLITGSVGDWIAWLAVCGVGAVLILLYRRQREVFFWGLFAFGTFLPGANLVFPIGTIMAERLLYLPAYGLIACLVLTVYGIGERTRMRWFPPAVLVLALLGFAVRTWERNPDWRNDLTLAESEVRAAPRSFKAHLMLSRALFAADPQHSRLDQTIEEGERTVALLDTLPDSQNTWLAYRELAGYYLLKGDGLRPAGPESKVAWQRATQLLSRAISILEVSPQAPAVPGEVVVPLDRAEAYRTLSGAWLRVSDAKKAYDAAVRARDLDPASPDAYRGIADALRATGREDDAISALMEGEMLTRDPSLARGIVLVYRSRGDAGCTLTEGPGGPEPNPACPTVRKQICEAVAGAMQIQTRLHREEEAKLMMNRAEERFGCTAL